MSAYGWGVEPPGVTPADIAAAIAAYALTDVGVKPLYSWTGELAWDDSAVFNPGPILPVGSTRAVGQWKIERDTIVAIGTFTAWFQAASGEILLDGVQSAAIGATYALNSVNAITGEWSLSCITTALPAAVTTITLDFWAIES